MAHVAHAAALPCYNAQCSLAKIFSMYSHDIQGGPKQWYSFWYILTSSIIDRFSKLFHYQNQEKICNNTITKNHTTP